MEGIEVLSYHFSQMYAVFILWPVPAENCIFFKIKFEVSGRYRSLPSIWPAQCTDPPKILTFYLRCNSQWITVAVLRRRLISAAKQGQQKDIL